MSMKKWQHLKIPFEEIKVATNNFEDCIGKGGYGWVYKGQLSVSGVSTMVAVKRLNETLGQGLKEFLTEIDLLSGQHHPNVISLLGYCDDGKEKIIVYEYAERGSLDKYIRRSNSTRLTWLERLKICVDAARGLDHLHNHVGEHQTIIHRDIKSANILLDENWVAKISDLGLSRLSFSGLDRSAVISHACGTPGYCEPEYIYSGVVKKESDVYSFGMVLFEAICGRLCSFKDDDGFLLSGKLAKEYYQSKKLDEIIDPSLKEQMSSYSKSRFSAIAYGCLHNDREQRPGMDVVTKKLEETLKIQEEYEFEKEMELKRNLVLESESDEYWETKLPRDVDEIIKMFEIPREVSNNKKELFFFLHKGILFDDEDGQKDSNKRHHPLDLNTLKGHGDAVNGLCFSSDGHSLATTCDDGVARVFKLDDASSKSFKFMRINIPAGGRPTAVAFADDDASVVVAAQSLTGASLYMYGEDNPKGGENRQHFKPEIKWEQHNVHDKKYIITLFGTKATHGAADGSTIMASSSEGTDIKLWHGKSGKMLGNVDTNQLKNNMATVSPDGRFIAAAAFTADVKVWEIVYSKDSSVKEVTKVMQLKGHKSAVTWLSFTPDSERIITASKDGSIRVWNIKVRYHLDEDPKTLKVFPIPLHDSKGTTLHYDRLSVSPDGKILAVSHASLLQWLSVETGEVLDTADKAHDGDITSIAWAPKSIPVGDKRVTILATSGVDKKVKLWAAPAL